MNILHLNLKRKWFDMILSGEKKEEYREIKDYWQKRLLVVDHSGPKFRHYDAINFKNGYKKNAPEFTVKLNKIGLCTGNVEWGAEVGKVYFVLSLGELIGEPRL